MDSSLGCHTRGNRSLRARLHGLIPNIRNLETHAKFLKLPGKLSLRDLAHNPLFTPFTLLLAYVLHLVRTTLKDPTSQDPISHWVSCHGIFKVATACQNAAEWRSHRELFGSDTDADTDLIRTFNSFQNDNDSVSKVLHSFVDVRLALANGGALILDDSLAVNISSQQGH
jgi:hypothetical protein